MKKCYRKTGLPVLLIISLFIGLTGAYNTSVQAKTTGQSVVARIGTKKVNKKIYTMKKGSSKKVRLVVIPKKAKVKAAYRSSKKNVVSVSKTGMLKAKKAGTAKITVKVSGKGNFRKKLWFKVKVVNPNTSDKKKEIPVTLTVSGKTFSAKFYDNQTVRALVKKMPMTLSMKELNGNEKYYNFDTDFPTNETSPKKIQAGEIKLYGSDCLVAFYKTHATSYQYTSVGYVEDVKGFVKAVGNGNVKITFQKDKETETSSSVPSSPAVSSDIPTPEPSVSPTDIPTPEPSASPSDTPVLSPAPSEGDDVSDTEDGLELYNIEIRINGKVFPAKLYRTETTESLMQKLPLSITMNELNGNEKYYYFSESFPTDSQKLSQIHAGDLKLYGSSCLVLFYETFPASYSYTDLGYVENPEGLAAALGTGNISVEIVL